MINNLKISNVHTILGRGEDIGKSFPSQERFPIFTARSVASLIDLVHWTKNIRKDDSVMHIFKGGDIRDEINILLDKVIKTNNKTIDKFRIKKLRFTKNFL